MASQKAQRLFEFWVALHSSSLRSRPATPHSSKYVRRANFYVNGGTFFCPFGFDIYMENKL